MRKDARISANLELEVNCNGSFYIRRVLWLEKCLRGKKIERLNCATCSDALLLLLLSRFSRVQLFATSWTVTHQAPLSMDFPGMNTGVCCHFLLQGNCAILLFILMLVVSPFVLKIKQCLNRFILGFLRACKMTLLTSISHGMQLGKGWFNRILKSEWVKVS